MHCSCCDRLLNDFESTRKSHTTGEYLDMCNKCFAEVADAMDVEVRTDLEEMEIPDEELDLDECVRYEEDIDYEE